MVFFTKEKYLFVFSVLYFLCHKKSFLIPRSLRNFPEFSLKSLKILRTVFNFVLPVVKYGPSFILMQMNYQFFQRPLFKDVFKILKIVKYT